MRRPRGFTLIEAVLVMIVISVGLLALASLFGGNMSALTVGEDTQSSAQYAQECAERVQATRRDLGFNSASINTSMCNSIALPSGFTRTVTVPATYTGTSTGACPNLATCRNVTVTVAKGASSAVITLMLVSY